LPTFEHMDAVAHLGQAMAGAAQHGGLAEGDPLGQHLAQALLRRAGPSRPTIVMLTGTLDSRLVCASSAVISTLCSIARLLGSKTSRTGASLPDSSRTASSTASTAGLELNLIGRERLLAGLELGVW